MYDPESPRINIGQDLINILQNVFQIRLPNLQGAKNYIHNAKDGLEAFRQYIKSLPEGRYPLYICLKSTFYKELLDMLNLNLMNINFINNPVLELDCLTNEEMLYSSLTASQTLVNKLSTFVDDLTDTNYLFFTFFYDQYREDRPTFITMMRMFSFFSGLYNTLFTEDTTVFLSKLYSTEQLDIYFMTPIYVLSNNIIFTPGYLYSIEYTDFSKTFQILLTNTENKVHFLSLTDSNNRICDFTMGGFIQTYFKSIGFIYDDDKNNDESANNVRIVLESFIHILNLNVKCIPTN